MPSGKVALGGVAVEAGDYLFTSLGEQHDLVGVTDALVFVSSRKPTPLVEV